EIYLNSFGTVVAKYLLCKLYCVSNNKSKLKQCYTYFGYDENSWEYSLFYGYYNGIYNNNNQLAIQLINKAIHHEEFNIPCDHFYDWRRKNYLFYIIGLYYYKKNEFNESIKYYLQIINGNGYYCDLSSVYYYLILNYYALNNENEMIEYYKKYKEINNEMKLLYKFNKEIIEIIKVKYFIFLFVY